MKQKILYQDNLIEIRNDSILLKNYYFPFFSKKILFDDIENIEVKEPTLLNGKWRIWGTGSPFFWFSFDLLRPIRKEIFIIKYKNQQVKSGFTVVDSLKVKRILKENERLTGIF